MLDQPVLNLPIKCPVCPVLLSITDIMNISTSAIFTRVKETAISKYLQNHQDFYTNCFKPGCPQYLCLLINHGTTAEAFRGGNIVWCDQCEEWYCINCSKKLQKPVVKHRGMTCKDFEEDYLDTNRDERLLRLRILDDCFTLKCPRCKMAFFDFSGCYALTCDNCKAGFCAFCLEDCNADAHPHVLKCPLNKGGGYFHNMDVFHQTHKTRNRDKAIQEISKIQNPDLRLSVLESIKKDIIDWGITITPEEVGITDIPPPLPPAPEPKPEPKPPAKASIFDPVIEPRVIYEDYLDFIPAVLRNQKNPQNNNDNNPRKNNDICLIQ
jgi:hypothetical protein